MEGIIVVAAAFMSTGASMPERLRNATLYATKAEATQVREINETGCDDAESRAVVLDHHAAMIESYIPGNLMVIDQVGLFQTVGQPK